MASFALISEMLRYPDAEAIAVRDQVVQEAGELAPGPARDALVAAARWWAAQPPDDLARLYVETFDFARRTGLDLTYYTHGDRRQRGLALVALRRRYVEAGLELESAELPDHLPVVLEFAAVAPAPGGELLAEFRPVIELLRHALERAGSPYAGVLRALCLMLPALTADERAELLRIAREGPPDESVGLEPFAPPEVMPEPRRRPRAGCGPVAQGVGG